MTTKKRTPLTAAKKGRLRRFRRGNQLRKAPEVDAAVNAVALALRCGPYFGKNGTIINFKEKPIMVRRWQEAFFDVLDMFGIEYDRKSYYASLDSKRRRSR